MTDTPTPAPSPVLPDYQGACTVNLVPELIKQVMGAGVASWIPGDLGYAKQIVLLVLDGLGWNQFQEHSQMLPTVSAFESRPITAVAPTSTPTGITSLITGRAPNVHGILSYRMAVDDQFLDTLSWTINGQPAESQLDPEQFQTQPSFAANDVTAVIERKLLNRAFTKAIMQDAPVVGYTTTSGLPIEVWRLAKAGEPFIYSYYGGIDAVAHDHGMDEHYDAELYAVDRLVRDILAGLPTGCALVITSDHGQVRVGNHNLDLEPHILEQCHGYSGEGRFRWLHTHGDNVETLVNTCRNSVGELAWVKTKQELSDEGWFGGPIPEKFWHRLGDVALMAHQAVAFKDPHHLGERNMVTRHGSLTADEVLVPLVVKVAD